MVGFSGCGLRFLRLASFWLFLGAGRGGVPNACASLTGHTITPCTRLYTWAIFVLGWSLLASELVLVAGLVRVGSPLVQVCMGK